MRLVYIKLEILMSGHETVSENGLIYPVRSE
jgi:hypothetical protein